jgi:hypothetical protein
MLPVIVSQIVRIEPEAVIKDLPVGSKVAVKIVSV